MIGSPWQIENLAALKRQSIRDEMAQIRLEASVTRPGAARRWLGTNLVKAGLALEATGEFLRRTRPEACRPAPLGMQQTRPG